MVKRFRCWLRGRWHKLWHRGSQWNGHYWSILLTCIDCGKRHPEWTPDIQRKKFLHHDIT